VLKAVNDPTIKTFPYVIDLDGNIEEYVKFDSVTKFAAYWHKCIIRNFGSIGISYRQAPGEKFNTIPAMSERAINGWGSYIEIKRTALPPQGGTVNTLINMYGVAEFELTHISEAMQ